MITTHVTLKRLPEAMAAHVDGVHDVIQEEHAAVFALVDLQLLATRADDADGILRVL